MSTAQAIALGFVLGLFTFPAMVVVAIFITYIASDDPKPIAGDHDPRADRPYPPYHHGDHDR